MKIKVLKIRISDHYQNMDEAVVNDYLDRYEILNISTELIKDDINYWSVLIHYKDKHLSQKASKITVDEENDLSEEEIIIYNKLKIWRSEKADKLKLPSYIIFHNKHLMAIARHKPSQIDDLQHISGLGKARIDKFGAEILKVLENA